MPEIAARVVIEGRVQGVGFRAWTAHEAARRNLRGWVRNRSDGSVELQATGEDDAVAALIEVCRQGPRAAIVTGVAVAETEDDGSAGFNAKPTA